MLSWKMREIDPIRQGWESCRRLRHSLSAKLITLLLIALIATFGLLGYLNIRLHRHHLEAAALTNAESISDVIKRSTSYYMLRNDREALYHTMRTMADEPGMVRVRIFDGDGRVSYSSDLGEISHIVDKNAEACYGCHSQSQPLSRLNRPDRFRIYRAATGERVLGIVTPLENQPSCSNAACHAHPASQQILGVLDTNLSLAKADRQLAQDSRRMAAYTILALALIAVLCGLFVWRVVAAPLKSLKAATEHLSEGRLGFQIATDSKDEFGDLARAFNTMSLQLRDANEEIVSWARTLEERVEQKTRELQTAHNQMLHAETMVSIGKMAAVVAHEINNPLSGILTYAKLMRKWLDRGETGGKHRQDSEQSLDLIARESRRCGDLVKNLLTFSRSGPMNPAPTAIHMIIDQVIQLVQHKLDMTGIQLQLDLAPDLPPLKCDAAQMEQVLLALVSNAADAMPRGGNLWLRTRLLPDVDEIEIQVRDDGSGIPPEILSRIFEPFVTTKESGHGVGLGLAVSHSIVERHRGTIAVQSELGRGTTFTVRLPLNGHDAELASAAVSAAAKER
jgi:two-component system, NtrC family, sensor kinase